MNIISKYASLVKFSHTIFAMPFALMSFVFAVTTNPESLSQSSPYWWAGLLVKVVLCMVFARNVAMGFNRWADRKIDAQNPRTAQREIPAGKISPKAALWFIAINAVLFIVTASTINSLTAWLSPVALAVVMFYSYIVGPHGIGAFAWNSSRWSIHCRSRRICFGTLRIGATCDDLVRQFRHYLCPSRPRV